MTWLDHLDRARKYPQDMPADESPVVAVAPNEAVLEAPFDDGWGHLNGPHVLIWTEQRVYFAVSFEGFEWLESAPRNPTAEPWPHVGAGDAS